MTELRNRIESFSGTVEELVDWVLQRGLDPSDVGITGTHLRFQSPETPEEAARRAAWEEQARQRTDEWERATYRRLREKFGDSA